MTHSILTVFPVHMSGKVNQTESFPLAQCIKNCYMKQVKVGNASFTVVLYVKITLISSLLCLSCSTLYNKRELG